MKKRGISAIVATVLIILITVAAVSIIWIAILPMIKSGLEFSALDGRVSVVGTGGYTLYDAEREIAMVQVKREVDEGVMDRIVVSFLVDGNSVSSKVVAPVSGGVKTYAFNFSGYGEPESVSVAPIFISGSKEKVGAITSDVDLKSGVISGIAAGSYEMGEDYFYEIFYEMPTTGLVSWWKFNGNFLDSAGGNDGDNMGTSADASSGVLVLDGSGYIGVGTDVFDMLYDGGGGTITLSTWIKVQGSAPARKMLIDLEGWYALFLQDGKPTTFFTGTSASSTLLNEYVADATWHHLVAVYDGTSQFIYLDGDLGGNLDVTLGDITSSVEINNIGLSVSLHPDQFFSGEMDNVMIFERALSEEEVVAIYEVQRKV